MTTAQVVETSVTVNNNSPIQDYVHPDDQTQPFEPYYCCVFFLHMLAKKNASRIVSLVFSHGRKSKTAILHAVDAHYFTTFQCLPEPAYFGILNLWKIKLGNTHLTNLEPLKSFKELFSFKTRHSDKGAAGMKSHRHIGDHTETMEKWQKCQKNRRLIKA